MSGHWKRRAVGLAVTWAVLVAAAGLLGMQPRVGLVALALAVTATAYWLFVDTSADYEGSRWALPDSTPPRNPGRDPGLDLLERVVIRHLHSREVDDTLHRQLVALVDRRLVARHGVSRLADPERARALLPPELVALVEDLDGPPRRLDLRRIDVLVSRIEDL